MRLFCSPLMYQLVRLLRRTVTTGTLMSNHGRWIARAIEVIVSLMKSLMMSMLNLESWLKLLQQQTQDPWILKWSYE